MQVTLLVFIKHSRLYELLLEKCDIAQLVGSYIYFFLIWFHCHL